ncbi:hypothetical protein JTB14_019104 [Gonioctena quinquepunctata]|nr:hypothetical protein JTB14_019104 [Gonioctena quinquepunctata]
MTLMIYKLGKDRKSPIIVEFVSYLKKLDFFLNKEKLIKPKDIRIAIANDICKEDQEEQKISENPKSGTNKLESKVVRLKWMESGFCPRIRGRRTGCNGRK